MTGILLISRESNIFIQTIPAHHYTFDLSISFSFLIVRLCFLRLLLYYKRHIPVGSPPRIILIIFLMMEFQTFKNLKE